MLRQLQFVVITVLSRRRRSSVDGLGGRGASATATPPGELVGLDDPAGQHRTTELEPLSHDLQAKFVKPAERAQVRAHEGA
jgi:hypothetical protein